MFTLSWDGFDGQTHTVFSSDYKTLWSIYYALTESLKNTHPNRNLYITCRDKKGFAYDGRILLKGKG